MTRTEAYRKFRVALRDPTRVGDAAMYKAQALGIPTDPRLARELLALGELPRIDLDALRELPRGTLGREYVEFMAVRALQPFVVDPKLERDVLERNIGIARYAMFHDVFHVLTGFDTRWAGELGVWAFVAAQRYEPMHRFALAMGCLLYPLIAPLQIPRLWKNLRRGLAMGRRADRLLLLPIEQWWARPVAELRAQLHIDAADELACGV
jgi:ubiquinone biosynthesis protein Coq4